MAVVNSCVIHVYFFLGLPLNQDDGEDTIYSYITSVDFQQITPENTTLQNLTLPPTVASFIKYSRLYILSICSLDCKRKSNSGDFSDPRLINLSLWLTN
jgi:hypothetical protein